MTTPTFPDATLLALDNRPVTGSDLLFLQQWYDLTVPETCYLLGITLLRWQELTREVGQPVGDPGVALLVWALLRFPEAQYLPTFPDPAEVYPLYEAMAAQSTRTLAAKRRGRLGKTAFGLLLGREATSAGRWLSPTHSRSAGPSVRRLLFAFRNVLLAHGVPGLETWVERVGVEAAARQLNLAQMTSWFRMPGHSNPRRPKPSSAGPPRPRGRPKRRVPVNPDESAS
jgi:hypothetical protein